MSEHSVASQLPESPARPIQTLGRLMMELIRCHGQFHQADYDERVRIGDALLCEAEPHTIDLTILKEAEAQDGTPPVMVGQRVWPNADALALVVRLRMQTCRDFAQEEIDAINLGVTTLDKLAEWDALGRLLRALLYNGHHFPFANVSGGLYEWCLSERIEDAIPEDAKVFTDRLLDLIAKEEESEEEAKKEAAIQERIETAEKAAHTKGFWEGHKAAQDILKEQLGDFLRNQLQ